MEKQELSNNVNRRDFLKKLGIIAAWGIVANFTLPTDAIWPMMELSEEQKQREQKRFERNIKYEQLNSIIPCDDRRALRQYLEDRGYIREYTRHQRIHDLPLDNSHRSQLTTLLEPIVQDTTNSNHAVYTLLHHLINKHMRKLSFAGIDQHPHRQLIWQLEETLPQWPKAYTHRYVDPTVIKLLDEANTQSLLSLTHVHHDRSYHVPEHHDDASEMEDIYEIDGIKKYSHNYAKKLLKQHNIWLRSSSMWTKEVGNNRSSNRSSLVWINASSIDGIIALIEDVRQRWSYRQTEYITWGTELGIHRAWPDWHEWWWKFDLWESLLILIILLEQWITKVGSYSNSIHIWDYEYIFNYHGPDRHLDILIKEIKKWSIINSHDSKWDTIPSKPRQKMIHRDLIRPKTSWPVA